MWRAWAEAPRCGLDIHCPAGPQPLSFSLPFFCWHNQSSASRNARSCGIHGAHFASIFCSDSRPASPTSPQVHTATIFDEYRQAEGSESGPLGGGLVQKGTGLGLSITKKFAGLLGGTIGVESEVGRGSTFSVTIPSDYRNA